MSHFCFWLRLVVFDFDVQGRDFDGVGEVGNAEDVEARAIVTGIADGLLR